MRVLVYYRTVRLDDDRTFDHMPNIVYVSNKGILYIYIKYYIIFGLLKLGKQISKHSSMHYKGVIYCKRVHLLPFPTGNSYIRKTIQQ